jgi:hypothetical protein
VADLLGEFVEPVLAVQREVDVAHRPVDREVVALFELLRQRVRVAVDVGVGLVLRGVADD